MPPLMQAFTLMLGDIHAADCSTRQVVGIEQWQDACLRAVAAAMACDPPGQQGMTVPATSSNTHRAWRDSARQILAALLAQVGEAEYRLTESIVKERKLRAEAEQHDETARQLEAQAAAAEGRAAQLRAQAATARAAAASAAGAAAASDKENGAAAAAAAAAAFTAEAESCEAAAGAAAADAEALRRQAAWHRAEAQRCREEAAIEHGRQGLLRAWLAAAMDAHVIGQRLITQEDAIAIPIGEAIAFAGGLKEVAADKHYFSVN